MGETMFWLFSTVIFVITIGMILWLIPTLIGYADSRADDEPLFLSRVKWITLRLPILIGLSVSLIVGNSQSSEHPLWLTLFSAICLAGVIAWGLLGSKYPEKNKWINDKVEKIVKQRMSQEMQKLLGRVGAYQTRPQTFEPYKQKDSLDELEEFLKGRISHYN